MSTIEAGRATADHLRLMTLMYGTIAAQVVGISARLGLADRLGDAERASAEVAAAVDAHPDATTRLLRALAALDLVAETGPDRYRLTETGALLRSDRPDSLHTAVLLLTDPAMLATWARPDAAVRTGLPVFERVHGADFFTHVGADPRLSERFNAMMRQMTLPVARALPGAYDFSRFHTVADIGGGDGTVLAEILRANPTLRGVLFDRAEGLAQAATTLDAAGVGDRCGTVAGDFFVSVPGGADGYLLKSVLHDWDDARCATLLGHCRAVIPDGGRLLIVETVLPDRIDPADPTPYLSDITMLVNTGGRERGRGEFAALCARSGFAVVATHPLLGPYSLIEAVPTG
ncbi:methyltransferase [Actinokineospora sp. UTMC 2448]|uniref:methyltransferase n=1 Tax=Actinokineospora sp. UTMC 2448 TaxID=2268449 RepID=UPI0021645E17|nr:methyltransferase [Actinokineospora sp. UTMC 2448]UVS79545.1 Multifunctional cyclase-dehydratase-3-O-methyl transferase TcmN [Actinokineospora sp. UTMC 2448]